MIRQLLALILIVTTVSNASFAQTSDPVKPVLVDRNSYHPQDKAIKLVRRENKLRRGKDAEFAVMLSTSSPNCGECLPTQLEEGEHPMLKSLKLNPSEGFSVLYAKAGESKFEALALGQPVYTQKGFAVLLKLHADRNLKAGDYALTGKATLEIEHRGKPRQEKEVEVAIPVTVVDKNEVVAQNSFGYKPYAEHRRLEVLATVLLIPLYLPFILVFVIACSISDCSD